MKTKAAENAMEKPVNPIIAAIKSFEAAKLINMPLWKVIPGKDHLSSLYPCILVSLFLETNYLPCV